MVSIKKTVEMDINFIAACLDSKSEDFCGQCGYGSRFFTYPVTADQIVDFQQKRAGSSDFFTIFNDDTPVGSFELITYGDAEDEKKESCNVARFLIADEYRFKGYGTEVLKLISEYAFNDLGLKKVTLCVFDFNASAMRCYQKAGFVEVKREIRNNGWCAIYMELNNKESET